MSFKFSEEKLAKIKKKRKTWAFFQEERMKRGRLRKQDKERKRKANGVREKDIEYREKERKIRRGRGKEIQREPLKDTATEESLKENDPSKKRMQSKRQ